MYQKAIRIEKEVLKAYIKALKECIETKKQLIRETKTKLKKL